MTITCIDKFTLFLSEYHFMILNIILVFSLAVVYSIVELLSLEIGIRSLLKTVWGWIYLFVNGFLGVLALLFTFFDEINNHIIGAKILLAGTSALALLRVLAVPIKHNDIENNVTSMIDLILNHVKREYDRQRSNFDLKDIKDIMRNIDFAKAADSLPLLTNSLLHTLKPNEAQRLKEDIQEIIKIDEGKEIRHLILGAILAKYIGIELLRNTVNGIREFISIDDEKISISDDDLESLIKKYL